MVICVVGALIGSRAVFAVFGFEYRLFGDPFHAGKLAFDLAVFVAFYLLTSWALGHTRYFASSRGA